MNHILLTNDDGYQSPGFSSLLNELKKTKDVYAVCPDKQKSWVGKSMTASKYITHKKQIINGYEINTLSGTPADCVQIGIYNLSKYKIDLVVSGINEGPNIDLGRILSSGTVGAGIEGYLQGIPSFCFSYSYPSSVKKPNFKTAAQIANKIIDEYYGKYKLLSVNIPYNANLSTEKIVVKKIQRKTYKQLFFEKDKDIFVHKKPMDIFDKPEKDSDVDYLSRGFITLTPFELNL
jgi:5'-nucleotidase